jgi:hypothetical protein
MRSEVIYQFSFLFLFLAKHKRIFKEVSNFLIILDCYSIKLFHQVEKIPFYFFIFKIDYILKDLNIKINIYLTLKIKLKINRKLINN